MAYDAPTPATFIARYPAFSAVSPETIHAALGDAGRWVDNSWIEADYARAIMMLAAHMMALEGLLGNIGGVNPALTGAITSKSLGDASISFASGNSGGTGGDQSALQLQRTAWGRSFALLRRANKGGSVTVV